MTDKEILNKIFKNTGRDLRLLDFECNKSNEELLIFNYIFSHDFAKAFWGEEMLKDKIITNAMNFIPIENWKWHLQQMVLETEPLKYLEKFL